MILFWLLPLMAFLATFSTVQAAEFRDYQIVRANCPLFERISNKWQRSSDPPLQSGLAVQGVPYPNTNWTVVRHGRKLYALANACLSDSRGTSHPVSATHESARHESARNESGSYGSYWYFFVSAMSWQEPLTLTSSDQRSYQLLSTNMGLCPGLGRNFRLSSHWSMSLSGCFLYASSEVGASDKDKEEISYNAEGVTIYGGQTGPRITWHTASRGFGIGLGVPMMYRIGNFPEPSGGYTLAGKSALRIGATLDLLMQIGSFDLIPRAGFLGSLNSLHWGVELGYRL